MAEPCRISIDGKVTATNGNPSQLYNKLLKTVGDPEIAQDLYILSETDDFKNSVLALDTPLDENNEPNPQLVLRYAHQLSKSNEQLNHEDRLSLENFWLQTPDIEDSYQLSIALQQALYNSEGLFLPTESSLEQSGLFTTSEVQKINNEPDLQQQLKEFSEKLENSPVVQNELDTGETLFSGKTIQESSLGLQKNINPWAKLNEIIEEYAGREEDIGTVEDYAVQKTLEEKPDELAEVLEKYTRVRELDSETLTPKLTRQFQPNSIKLTTTSQLEEDIALLNTIDAEVLKTTEGLNYIIKLEQDLAGLGIDVTGWAEQENFRGMVNPLVNFLGNPSQENLETLEDTYAEVFGQPREKEEQIMEDVNKDRALFFVRRVQKTEQELLEQDNLIKTNNPNVYHKIQRVPLDALEAALPDNFVEDNYGQIKDVQDSDVAKEIAALKGVYGYPMQAPMEDTATDFAEKYTSFEANAEYLTTDFVADFNARTIQEKQKNSQKWQEFYNKFKITDRGIELVSEDPLSLREIEIWMESGEIAQAEELKEYSKLSKVLPVLGTPVEETIEPFGKEYERTTYINNPEALPLTNKAYQSINADTLLIRSANESFVRTPQGIYEMIETRGSDSLFIRLGQNTDPNYYDFQPNIPQAPQNIDSLFNKAGQVSDRSMTNVQRTMTKVELENIERENFECKG